MTDKLLSNIYWLWIGVNDLITGYCSEEAVVLGILRTAEELSWRDPDAIIVVQGILPLSKHGASLEGPGPGGFFHHNKKEVHSVAKAKEKYYFWPSIEAINRELEKFCTGHPKMVYFDAGHLFLGSMGNSVYQTKAKMIIHELMTDFIHPSYNGYKILFKRIREEVERILFDDDEGNDIEEKEGQRRRQ